MQLQRVSIIVSNSSQAFTEDNHNIFRSNSFRSNNFRRIWGCTCRIICNKIIKICKTFNHILGTNSIRKLNRKVRGAASTCQHRFAKNRFSTRHQIKHRVKHPTNGRQRVMRTVTLVGRTCLIIMRHRQRKPSEKVGPVGEYFNGNTLRLLLK